MLECLSQGSGRAALSVYRGRPVPPVLLPLPPAAGLGSQRRARLLHLHPRGESAGGGGVAVTVTLVTGVTASVASALIKD